MKLTDIQQLKVGDAVSFYEGRKLRTIIIEQFEMCGDYISINTHLLDCEDADRRTNYYLSTDRIHGTPRKARLLYGVEGLPTILLCTALSILVCNIVGIFAWSSILICLGISIIGHYLFK